MPVSGSTLTHPAAPTGPVASSTLADLILAVDCAVHTRASHATMTTAIAEAIRSALPDPHLLARPDRLPSYDGYRTKVLHVAPDGSFSVVAVVWLPGQRTPIHSHRSWGVIGVHEGIERETTYARRATRNGTVLEATHTVDFRSGDVAILDSSDDIHAVENAGDSVAISIHVYGMDYRRDGTSIRERFSAADVVTGW